MQQRSQERKQSRVKTYTKGQQSKIDQILRSIWTGTRYYQNQGFQGGQEWLNSLFNDPEFFNKFEAPLRRDFQERTLPGIANRFGGMGTHGSFGGGFERAMGRAGTDFETNLGALRGGLQQTGK